MPSAPIVDLPYLRRFRWRVQSIHTLVAVHPFALDGFYHHGGAGGFSARCARGRQDPVAENRVLGEEGARIRPEALRRVNSISRTTPKTT